MKIDSNVIGDGFPTFIIAEIGINHNGNIEEAFELIDAAKNSGADAVKLQSYITEKRVKKDSPIFDILKKSELTFDQQKSCFKFGRDLGLTMFSTPFDNDSIEFLESINCSIYKVASFDSVNKALLRKIGSTKKPVIMSTGMTNVKELSEAWKSLGGKNDGSGCDLALLHCISSYPTPTTEANLSMIHLLKSLHNGPIGYSDHTIGSEIPIMAVAAGARIIEKHFTLDTSAEGPDHALSADPKIMKEMIDGVRRMEKILGSSEMKVREIEKSIVPFRRFSD